MMSGARFFLGSHSSPIEQIPQENLRQQFSQYGQVTDMILKLKTFHNSTPPRHYYIVIMEESVDREAIVKNLNGLDFGPCTLKVENMKVTSSRSSNSNDRGGGKRTGDNNGWGNPAVSNAKRQKSGSDSGTGPIFQCPGEMHPNMSGFEYGRGWAKLTIMNVPESATEDNIRDHFSEFTTVHEVIKKERTDTQKSNMFFIKIDEMTQDTCVQKTNNQMFLGEKIRVEYSRPKNYRKIKNHNNSWVRLVLFRVNEDCSVEDLKLRFDTFSEVNECKISPDKKGNYNGYIDVVSDSVENVLTYFKLVPYFGYRKCAIEVATTQPAGGGMPGGGIAGGNMPMNMSNNNFTNMQQQAMFMQNQMAAMQNMQQQMSMQNMQQIQQNIQPMANNMINGVKNNYSDWNNKKENNPPHIPLGLGGSCSSIYVPAPKSQEEVNELIQERERLESITMYEQWLVENLPDDGMELPKNVPPPNFFKILKDRTIVKCKLQKAVKSGFVVK